MNFDPFKSLLISNFAPFNEIPNSDISKPAQWGETLVKSTFISTFTGALELRICIWVSDSPSKETETSEEARCPHC